MFDPTSADHRAALVDRLRRRWPDIAVADLVPLPMKGVAHDHLALPGLGLVVRVPRLSQWSMPAEAALVYQSEGFRRAAPSGVTPHLHMVLPPDELLLRGALVVDFVAGRAPRLPDELLALAQALAAIHRVPTIPPRRRPPLADHAPNPIAATVSLLDNHARFLAEDGVLPGVRQALTEQLAWAHALARTAETAAVSAPITLVATDTHPGNFLVGSDGIARFVDLEKVLYGLPAIDLAHATLYTSTQWDREVMATLDAGDLARFHQAYAEAVGPAAWGRLEPWVVPARRLTWLRTTLWAIRWRALAASDPDWSSDRIEPALIAHIQARVADFTAPATIERMRAELAC
ncbi:MAG TPA: phosphotransferase [Aliidongia sp.]|uniref:phosphotransferase n=1 Tax=Aliidongia sp. TaxID=1914230 RepID=UPI002DDD77EC|nr:phosphotransferase [Aliidongia sp.]HEV2673815.1 phosphotransferase [Aliidongia sp.]